jgi:hypothetical protein
MANTTKEKGNAENPAQNVAQSTPQIKFNSANLHSSYANFCNANSTREEVVLNFGINNNWDRTAIMEIDLNHRVVLSPFAAKRLATMMQQLMKEYETRYGALSE